MKVHPLGRNSKLFAKLNRRKSGRWFREDVLTMPKLVALVLLAVGVNLLAILMK